MVSASNTFAASSDGVLKITVNQTSQNQAANTSQVQVIGTLINTGSGSSFHSDPTITADISGTDSFTGGDFSYSLGPGDSLNFISHTFTVTHASDGTKTVSFTVHYGSTGTSTFPGDQSVSVSLALTRIPKRPSAPGKPAFSNEMPTTLTVKWTASTDNNGKAITSYKLRRYTGSSPTGAYVDSDANSLSRNVTGLTPGTNYTFTVYAFNGSADNGGYSNPSAANSVQQLAGVWVRVSGVWKIAVPYIRSGGVWKMAIPYVRSGGVWKQTN
jgi:hypothetical protein